MGVGMYVLYGSDKVKFLTIQLPEIDYISWYLTYSDFQAYVKV